jgi:hypothetical protein
VAADETARRPATSATKLRLRWLVIVVAIMALLTAGWPLLNMAVANRRPLAAGSRLTVGPAPGNSAVVTVGAGWYVLPAQSNPTQGYVLHEGNLDLSITHVSMVNHGQAPLMWRGLRRILSVSHPGARLSRPVHITFGHGLRAITGVVVGSHFIGTATIFPGPSRQFAIEMIVFAPLKTSPALRAAAVSVIRSLVFTAESR